MIDKLEKYIWWILGFFLSPFIGHLVGSIISLENYITVPFWVIFPLLFIMIGLSVSFIMSKLIEDKKENDTKLSNDKKKTLPFDFRIHKILKHSSFGWDVSVKSKFHPDDNNVNKFINNIVLSKPHCIECKSELIDEVNVFLWCPNQCTEDNIDLKDKVEIEILILGKFSGEIRKNFHKWKKVYVKEYEKYTKGKNDDFKLPNVITSYQL